MVILMKPFEPYAHTHGQADRKLYDIEVAVSRIIVSCFKKIKKTDQTTNTGKTLLRFCVCVCVCVCECVFKRTLRNGGFYIKLYRTCKAEYKVYEKGNVFSIAPWCWRWPRVKTLALRFIWKILMRF